MKEGFLAAQWVQQTTVAAVEAAAEVKDAEGNVVTPAVEAVEAEYADKLHRAYIEYDTGKIIQDIAADTGDLYYYRIVPAAEGRTISLEHVSLKAGAREKVTKEVVEIEAGGESLGSAEV